MAKAPKTFATPVEGTFRRHVRALDKSRPRPKRDVDPAKERRQQKDRMRAHEAEARAMLPDVVAAEVRKATGHIDGEDDTAHEARVMSIAAGRMAGQSAARSAADHAARVALSPPTATPAKPTPSDPPPTPRDPSVARARP
jgi:hypothetical protein